MSISIFVLLLPDLDILLNISLLSSKVIRFELNTLQSVIICLYISSYCVFDNCSSSGGGGGGGGGGVKSFI